MGSLRMKSYSHKSALYELYRSPHGYLDQMVQLHMTHFQWRGIVRSGPKKSSKRSCSSMRSEAWELVKLKRAENADAL